MNLQAGSLLRNGGYKIIRTLGRGGFGITYLAEQPMMERKVCVKEFFLENFCDRDAETSRVSLGTAGNALMVQQYQSKFLKEARTIARLDHKNIIRIYDVFEDNNTAYYVMEYIDGSSLADYAKEKGALPESEALGYIRQAGEALSYAHEHKIMHLDVKPANMMLARDGRLVLIDFGLSKQYSEQGEQTSSTPVGISHGYAPLEQYKAGGVSSFSPQTDIYSLGASLYRLVSGLTPPQATDIVSDGFPARPSGISDATWAAIQAAMSVRIADRPASVEAFLALLEGKAARAEAKDDHTVLQGDGNKTVIPPSPNECAREERQSAEKAKYEAYLARKAKEESKGSVPKKPEKGKKRTMLYIIAGAVLALFLILLLLLSKCSSDSPAAVSVVGEAVDTTGVNGGVGESLEEESPVSEMAKTGSIKFSSTPSGASIWLDGQDTKKKTPAVLDDVSEGKHSYRLVLDGYEALNGTVKVTAGQQASMSGALKERSMPPVAVLEEETKDEQPAVQEYGARIIIYSSKNNYSEEIVKEGTVRESSVSDFIKKSQIIIDNIESVRVVVSIRTIEGSQRMNQSLGERMASDVSLSLQQKGISASMIETEVLMNAHDSGGRSAVSIFLSYKANTLAKNVESPSKAVETVEFFRVEVKPTFQGGDVNAFSKWVAQHLEYPESAKENGIMGNVIIQFTIDVDGTLTDIKVIRGVDKALDDEALRVVKSSPKWTPGKGQEGQTVKVTYTFPVVFQLR